jgi:rare lipoprotein A
VPVEAFAQRATKPTRRAAKRRAKGRQVGLATFYGREFHGDKTASGERYDPDALTAAHRTWPFGTVVRVTELESGRNVVVRITDRGPFGKNRRKGAIIDLSRAAARQLRMVDDGVIRVRLNVIRWGGSTDSNAQRR